MAEVILMPRLSDTMTEGVIAAWHKKIGDPVKKGDLLAEVETDKATMELESYKDGTLLHIGTDKGGKLQVNDLLAIIGSDGEDISGLVEGSGENAPANIEKAGVQHKETITTTANQDDKKEPLPTSTSEKSVDVSKMEEVILMPRLSDTMTEGVISSWHKNVGDNVKKGDVLADIETDKATMELESYKEGTLLHIGAQNGEKIMVNDLLAIIGDAKKVDVQKILSASKGAATPVTTETVKENQPQQASVPTQEADQPAQSHGDNGRIKASPLAKKIATEKGIDIAQISGSGDGGRIVKKDIDNFKPAAANGEPSRTIESPNGERSRTIEAGGAERSRSAETGQVSFDEVPVSQMRKVIAKRLSESKFTAPHFYLTISIDMDKAVESRAKLNEVSKIKISFNDMVLKACALALKQHPKVNCSWLGDKIRYNHHINIGVAVAVEEGLLVPVVRFADTKSLSQIAGEVKEYAQKAKDKKLQPADWEGNTFTISNLGMFGIDEFTAIINTPDACILAIGAIQQVPVVKNGAIVPGNVMKVTLSCDHRAVDGATGSAFLQTLQGLLVEPLRMLV